MQKSGLITKEGILEKTKALYDKAERIHLAVTVDDIYKEPTCVNRTFSNKELLAMICHEQWSEWMRHLLEMSFIKDDGSILIQAWTAETWKEQMGCPYEDLREEEKDNNRIEANRVITWFEKFGISLEMRPFGKWVNVDLNPSLRHIATVCSECKTECYFKSNFCPTCGAHMIGGFSK